VASNSEDSPQTTARKDEDVTDVEQEIAEQMGDDDVSAEADGNGATAETDAATADDTAASESAAPRSQADIDKLTRQLEKEAERHAKRVAEIMGDDFALLVPSPVDWTPGFLFNVAEMLPTPEQVAELHALLGGGAPVELREAEDARSCDKCNGLGDVLTGSRKPGQETKPCSGCGGVGWVHKAAPVALVAPIAGTASQMPVSVPTPETYQVKDSWGRPMGHPHFGLDPVSVGV
jgi:hypothetical protein